MFAIAQTGSRDRKLISQGEKKNIIFYSFMDKTSNYSKTTSNLVKFN